MRLHLFSGFYDLDGIYPLNFGKLKRDFAKVKPGGYNAAIAGRNRYYRFF